MKQYYNTPHAIASSLKNHYIGTVVPLLLLFNLLSSVIVFGQSTLISTLTATSSGPNSEFDQIVYISSSPTRDQRRATSFTNGSSACSISSITLQDAYSNPWITGYTVRIFSSNGDGTIGSQVQSFSYSSNNLSWVTFLPQEVYVLQPATTYWLMVNMSAGNTLYWAYTNSAPTTSGGAAIPATKYRAYSNDGGSTWLYDANTLKYNQVAGSGLYGTGYFAYRFKVVVNSLSTATWTGNASADWNSTSNWNPATVPTFVHNVTIPDVTNDPVIASGTTASCNNLTINSGASLTVQSTASGTGSLITNGTVTGNMTIQRYVTGSTNLEQNKYHLVSVPLHPDNNSLSDLFVGSYLYEYLPATNAWNGLNTPTTTSLSENTGYMIYYPNTSTTYTFTGQANTGSFTPTVTYPGNSGGSNFALVPNPYPSNIDWNASSGWTKTNIGSTVWAYNPTFGNYATWNGSSATNGGSRYISVGQAFFVQTTATSPSLVMGNGVRTHTGAAFLKNGNILASQLRIKADAGGMADEALVGFSSQSTGGYDAADDALKLYGAANAPQLYTVGDNHELSINNSGALNGNAEISLNYKNETEGEAVLTFSQIENFPSNVSIYLNDELTGQTINLRNQPVYSFSHQAANAANRFKLVFGSAIGIDDSPEANNRMWITNNTLYISTPKPSGQSALIEIYNTAGQMVLSQSVVLNDLTTLKLNMNGPVVARLTTNGAVLTVKGIVIRRH